jgi:glucokinase
MMMNSCSIGLDLGGTHIKAVVVAKSGEVLRQAHLDTPPGRQVNAVVKALAEVCQGFIVEHPEVDSIGLGAPGLVDLDRKVIRVAPNFPAWKDVPLSELVSAKIQRPVLLENDVNCFGLAEHRWGAGRGFKNLIALAVGTGIGGAIILDGQLYRGSSGAAGELGHISVDLWGPKCGCGNLGCVERYLGEQWFTREAQTVLGPVKSPAEISARAQAGDVAALQYLEGRGEILGVACTTLIHIFDPEAIVIGGGIAQAGEAFFRGINRAIRERAYTALADKVQILPAQLGTYSGAMGAALLE